MSLKAWDAVKVKTEGHPLFDRAGIVSPDPTLKCADDETPVLFDATADEPSVRSAVKTTDLLVL